LRFGGASLYPSGTNVLVSNLSRQEKRAKSLHHSNKIEKGAIFSNDDELYCRHNYM
jgi:hypothetical protein